jgi:hypothetical protein
LVDVHGCFSGGTCIVGVGFTVCLTFSDDEH